MADDPEMAALAACATALSSATLSAAATSRVLSYLTARFLSSGETAGPSQYTPAPDQDPFLNRATDLPAAEGDHDQPPRDVYDAAMTGHWPGPPSNGSTGGSFPGA